MAEDQEHLQDHWRELAELLGVEGNAGTEPEKPRSAPTPEPSQRPGAPAHREEIAPAAVAEQPHPENHARGDTEARDAESQSPEAVALETERESAPAPEEERQRDWEPAGEEEDRPRRGRRRRGRRGRSERREFAPADSAREEPRETADEPEGLNEDEGGFHSAAESQHDELVEEEADEQMETVPPAAAEDDDEIDEEDNLSDWNVPSWNELIASLYRPER